jgi:eukaryotic-like serine/threonine-protein kinase
VQVPPPDGGTSSGTVAAVSPKADTIRGHLAALVSRLDCASINVEVNNDLGVRLTGSIDTQKNQAEFLRRARAIEGVGRVDSAIEVRPWPRCELDAIANLVTSTEFRIIPNKTDKPYKIDHDAVSFRVVPPSGRQGFLNFVFLQSDKTAFHYEPWSQVAVRLGDKELADKNFGAGLNITFGPPAGKMAIVAVFSFEPLTLVPFDQNGQANQESKEYIATLKKILARHPGAIVSYIVFDTVL